MNSKLIPLLIQLPSQEVREPQYRMPVQLSLNHSEYLPVENKGKNTRITYLREPVWENLTKTDKAFGKGKLTSILPIS